MERNAESYEGVNMLLLLLFSCSISAGCGSSKPELSPRPPMITPVHISVARARATSASFSDSPTDSPINLRQAIYTVSHHYRPEESKESIELEKSIKAARPKKKKEVEVVWDLD